MHRLFFLVFGSRSQNTREKRVVYHKFSTGKCRPGIAFTTALIIYIYGKTTAKVWCWYQRCLWRNGAQVSFGNIPTEKTGALSIQPKRPVWIFRQLPVVNGTAFSKISRTTSRGIPKIFGNFSPEFLEFSVECFAIQQFPEFLETFPGNFCSICRCYANFRKFWFNSKRPRSTCSDVLLLPYIFHRNDPKSRVSFTFKPDFPEPFCKW